MVKNYHRLIFVKLTLTLAVLVGKVRKNYLPKEEGREGGKKKKHAQRASAGARARSWDLPRARRDPQLHAMGVV